MRHRHTRYVLVFGCIILLAACGGDSGGSFSTPPNAQTLCASNSCGQSETLAIIPDAENILFTADGRLFVSGDRIYEISRDNDGFAATPLPAAGCTGSAGFLGLAQRANTIYSPCNTGTPRLYAAALTTNPQLVPIHNLSGTSLPNGVATDNQGRMYIVNGPLAQPPVILRLEFDPNDPMHVVSQEVWLDSDLENPNGIVFDGEDFYITDSNAGALQIGVVKRISLNADGSPGPVEIIYAQSSIFDDLSVAGPDQLLVSDFVLGRFMLISKSGQLIAQTSPGTYRAVSAVQRGVAPLFSSSDILVTDKGLLNERTTAIGNLLAVFRPKE